MHMGSASGFADSYSIVGIVLAALALQPVGLNQVRSDNARIQPQANEPACPVVRTGAGLHGDQAARRQLRTPGGELVAHQRPAGHPIAYGINGVNLDDLLCQIDTDSCNLVHGTSPFKGFRLTSAHQSWHSMPLPESGKSLRIRSPVSAARSWRAAPSGPLAAALAPSCPRTRQRRARSIGVATQSPDWGGRRA